MDKKVVSVFLQVENSLYELITAIAYENAISIHDTIILLVKQALLQEEDNNGS